MAAAESAAATVAAAESATATAAPPAGYCKACVQVSIEGLAPKVPVPETDAGKENRTEAQVCDAKSVPNSMQRGIEGGSVDSSVNNSSKAKGSVKASGRGQGESNTLLHAARPESLNWSVMVTPSVYT